MSVKETARRIYVRIIDSASQNLSNHIQPKEGWLMTMRKALNMSGPQLARRASVTKAAIYQAERKELAGEITIKQMEKLASALGGKFVYAIVPTVQKESSELALVSDVVRAQARAKAETIVKRASTHMAMEKQALPDNLEEAEIERMTDKLVADMPPGFWDER